MIANSNVSASMMKRALIYTLTALTVAADADFDRSEEDRYFFSMKKQTLEQLYNNLIVAMSNFENYNNTEVVQRQLRVNYGDNMLDGAVSKSKSQMKLTLDDKIPGAAEKVFGNDISKITKAEMKAEPYLVLDCVNKLVAGPDFNGRNELVQNLEKRARIQINNIVARDETQVRRNDLQNKVTIAITEASAGLSQLKLELLMRFANDRDYVATFFMNVKPKKKKDDEDDTETEKK